MRASKERRRKNDWGKVGARLSSSSWHCPSFVIVATTDNAAVVVIIVVRRCQQRQQHRIVVVVVVVVVVEAQGIMGTVYGVKTKIRLMSLQNNLFFGIVVNVSLNSPPPS